MKYKKQSVILMGIVLGVSILTGKCTRNPCSWCENGPRNILRLCEGKQGAGLLNINSWELIPLVPEEEKESGMMTIHSQAEKEGSMIEVTYNIAQKKTQGIIHLGEKSMPDQKKMRKFLCRDCVEKFLKECERDVVYYVYESGAVLPIMEMSETKMEAGYEIWLGIEEG